MRGTARYMPFFGEAFFRDTAHLGKISQNCYLRLIWHAWTQDGTIPDSMPALANICGESLDIFKSEIWPELAGFFDPVTAHANAGANAGANADANAPAKLTQKKLWSEWRRVQEISGKRSDAARESHKNRPHGGGMSSDINKVSRKKASPRDGSTPLNGSANADANADANAQQMHVQLHTESTIKEPPFIPPRGGARRGRGKNPFGFPQHTEAAGEQAEITVEPETGKRLIRGFYLDVVWEEVTQAARIDPTKRASSGLTEGPLIAWLSSGYHPDSIVEVIKEISSSSAYQPPWSLKYFDNAVRQRALQVSDWNRKQMWVA